jgi:hypothetical protein
MASSNITRMIKSTRITWTGHVARVGEMRNVCKMMVGNLKGRDHSKDLGVDGRISEWFLKR